ncbi:MAG: hypothetical protein LBP80_09565 [Treponema sp.]|jgi:hypothetical protein|nr:hypothetical protein [Treponema sp.]
MNVPEEGEAPYQFWVKKPGLKIFTPSAFQKYLTGAGFTHVNISGEGKDRVCVSAMAGK